MMTDRDPRRFLSPDEFARQIGLSVWTVYRMVHAGELESTRIRGRIRIPASELVRLVEKGR